MKTEKELNNELRQLAIDNGLCQEWQNEWKEDWELNKMVHQFYRGIDFYLKNRFIPKSLFIEDLRVEFRRGNGLLVDDQYSLLNPKHAVLIGDSVSVVRVNGWNASVIYALDSSKLKVTAKDWSFVVVHVLDNAHVDAHSIDKSRLVVIKHSCDCEITGNGVLKEEYDYLK